VASSSPAGSYAQTLGHACAIDPAAIGDLMLMLTLTTTMTPPLAVSSGGYVGFGILYLVLLVVLGLTAIKKGHWIMFVIGIFIPIFWLIGALLPPTQPSE
jgi:hypothetical protein